MFRRIAILKPSALGDVVHALPVLSAVRARFPDAHIAWVVNRAFEPLIAGHPHLTETIPFDRGGLKRDPLRGIADTVRFGNLLRRRRFDLVLDLQGLLRTGLMAAATGARTRVGFANAREGATRFYTHRVGIGDAVHAVDRCWKMAEAVGASGPMRFVLPARPVEREAVDRELSGLPRPWVAVAVGARWLTKRWPLAHFAELLRRAQSAFGGTALFVGTADDGPLSQEVMASLTGPARDLAGRTSLPRLAALLAAADVMVSNDTGPLHLAAALGRPCVAPYTCTKAARHGPYGSAGGVETAVPCGGSYLRVCPNGTACFAELTPDRLWGPLSAVLASCRTSRSA